MATKKATIKVCDVCGKSVSDNGEMHFGGHPHNGWYHVDRHGGATDLDSLRRDSTWDVCGIVCLTKLGDKLKY